MAKKDPSAVIVAHMLKKSDNKPETHSNGSEIHPNVPNVPLPVKQAFYTGGCHGCLFVINQLNQFSCYLVSFRGVSRQECFMEGLVRIQTCEN